MLPVVENIYHFKLFFQSPAQPATGMDYGEMVANEMLIFFFKFYFNSECPFLPLILLFMVRNSHRAFGSNILGISRCHRHIE
jgi:hypothetical protein